MEEKVKSFFKFEITQTTKVILYKIEKGDGRHWNVVNKDDRHLVLQDMKKPENQTLVDVYSGIVKITTAHGYVYTIVNKDGNRAEVDFHGPVNALLTQSLMPRLTYVPQTLRAMSSDMTGFVGIDEFMARRKDRHGDKPNPQDVHGWRVNMKFCNELAPWLPPFRSEMREKTHRQSGKFPR